MFVAIFQKLPRLSMLQLLSEIETSEDPGISIYIPAGSAESEIKSILSIVSKEEMVSGILNQIVTSHTGAVLFWGEHYKYLILPPFSIIEKVIYQDYCTGPLFTLLNKDLIVALVLVRLGNYAIGVFQKETLISCKVGTGIIHSRHKKGGSSSQRYARHRDKQIEYFFSRICTHIQEQLNPVHKSIDFLYYGGEKFTIRLFRAQCAFLKEFDNRAADVLLNVRDPRQASLKSAIREVWASNIISWQEREEITDI